MWLGLGLGLDLGVMAAGGSEGSHFDGEVLARCLASGDFLGSSFFFPFGLLTPRIEGGFEKNAANG